MTAEILTCEQRSPEWYSARLGIPTASEFKSVLAKGEGKVRKAYMLRLAGERLTGVAAESYENDYMIRGRELEAEARELYCFTHDADVDQVGFIRNGDAGCSPDGLIALTGMCEIKSKLPHLQIECLLRDDLPPEHRAQVQGSLLVAEREWLDFISYWPGLPLCVRRIHRDEAYIENLALEVARFNDELALIVEQVQRYGQPPREVLREQLRASL